MLQNRQLDLLRPVLNVVYLFLDDVGVTVVHLDNGVNFCVHRHGKDVKLLFELLYGLRQRLEVQGNVDLAILERRRRQRFEKMTLARRHGATRLRLKWTTTRARATAHDGGGDLDGSTATAR
ncbi:unnamed protein product [Heligmosomoides polygyrus]|uniref:Integrase catalytic domain-containing protein n=1 Tax=Heligmosomoides polygyrus TaxID=6339 RepID=A0A183G154_HELPZ|nr:unnamed protein product [Heligmosomoides polygyrus]